MPAFHYWGRGPVGPGFLMYFGGTRNTSSGGGIPFDKQENIEDPLTDKRVAKRKRETEIAVMLLLMREHRND